MIKVYINDHDMFEEFGIIMSKRSIGTAKPRIYKQSIIGKNGDLDYTPFFGDLTYENRTITIEFSKKRDSNTQSLKYQLERILNGKEVRLSFSDDESHYYKGRLSVESNDDDFHLYDLKVTIDAHPFKFKKSDDSEVK